MSENSNAGWQAFGRLSEAVVLAAVSAGIRVPPHASSVEKHTFAALEALAELTSAPAEPPEGFVLVPVEPTDAMTWAGQQARYPNTNSITVIYKAMLAAAPPQTPQAAGAIDAREQPTDAQIEAIRDDMLSRNWDVSRLHIGIVLETASRLIPLASREEAPPAAGAAQAVADSWPKLDKPAQVGGGSFGKGVSTRLVVEAAQRRYEIEAENRNKTHEQRVEDERSRRAGWDLFNSNALAATSVALPEGWTLVEKKTCYVLQEGNTIVATLAGPDAELNASRIAAALAATPAPAETALQEAHRLGFLRAAGWMQSERLFADVNGLTYRKDRDHDLAALKAAHPGERKGGE